MWPFLSCVVSVSWRQKFQQHGWSVNHGSDFCVSKLYRWVKEKFKQNQHFFFPPRFSYCMKTCQARKPLWVCCGCCCCCCCDNLQTTNQPVAFCYLSSPPTLPKGAWAMSSVHLLSMSCDLIAAARGPAHLHPPPQTSLLEKKFPPSFISDFHSFFCPPCSAPPSAFVLCPLCVNLTRTIVVSPARPVGK